MNKFKLLAAMAMVLMLSGTAYAASVNVTLISTNDTYLRDLGIMINGPLPSGWYNGNTTCHFFVSRGNLGATYTCGVPANEIFTNATASVSAYPPGFWNITITGPYGASKTCNYLNVTTGCTIYTMTTSTTVTTTTILPHVQVKLISTNDVSLRSLGIAMNKQLPADWWNVGGYTCNATVWPGYITFGTNVLYTCDVPLNQSYHNVSVGISSSPPYFWNITLTDPHGVNKTCDFLNVSTRCTMSASNYTSTTTLPTTSTSTTSVTTTTTSTVASTTTIRGHKTTAPTTTTTSILASTTTVNGHKSNSTKGGGHLLTEGASTANTLVARVSDALLAVLNFYSNNIWIIP